MSRKAGGRGSLPIPVRERLLCEDLPRSAPGEWDEGAALKETFLLLLPRSSAEAVRQVLLDLFVLYVEKGPGEGMEPTPRTQLRAVERELRHTARFLAWIARETLEVFVYGEADRRRGRLADRLAVQVEKVADEIAIALRPLKPRRQKAGPA